MQLCIAHTKHRASKSSLDLQHALNNNSGCDSDTEGVLNEPRTSWECDSRRSRSITGTCYHLIATAITNRIIPASSPTLFPTLLKSQATKSCVYPSKIVWRSLVISSHSSKCQTPAMLVRKLGHKATETCSTVRGSKRGHNLRSNS